MKNFIVIICISSLLIGVFLAYKSYDIMEAPYYVGDVKKLPKMRSIGGAVGLVASSIFFGLGLIGLIISKQSDKPESE